MNLFGFVFSILLFLGPLGLPWVNEGIPGDIFAPDGHLLMGDLAGFQMLRPIANGGRCYAFFVPKLCLK